MKKAFTASGILIILMLTACRQQFFIDIQIISLPHPQARGISDEYVAALKPPIHVIHKIIEKQMQNGRSHASL